MDPCSCCARVAAYNDDDGKKMLDQVVVSERESERKGGRRGKRRGKRELVGKKESV